MSANRRANRLHCAWYLFGTVFLVGCFFGSEKDKVDLVGTWEYIDTSKLAGSPLYFKTYWDFRDSQTFRYRYVPMAKTTIQYDGEWKVTGDTIRVYPKQCLTVGNGASDSLFQSACPDSSWGNAKVYWDGIRVFDFEGHLNGKRIYRKL